MEPGEREDDEQYPPAPLPQHEREWRHPSEIGQAAWVRNEPPLAIGRGLLVTTGVIGGLIGLAVLWTMLPATSDGGVTALSTVVSRVLDNSAAGALTRDSATLGAPVPTIQVSPRVVTSAPAVAVAIGDHRLLITTAAAVGDR